MLGEIFLLDLSYAPGAQGPSQMVAKFAALREGSLAAAVRGRIHERELRCFDELLVDTPANTPENYGTWYDPQTAHFLLLQSAVEVDEDVDQVEGLSATDAELVLREMARLHSRWWHDPALSTMDWLPRLDAEARVNNLTALAGMGWDPLCEMMGDGFSDAERALGSGFSDRLQKALSSLAKLPSTLIHGDMRADNLLFSPDHSTVTIVDWQGCGVGPPAFDLAYFMSHSLSVETRREFEDDLLEYYRSALHAAGVSATAEEVRRGYGESLLFGLAVACALPIIGDSDEPRVQSLATTVARRSIEALRDHGQLWTPLA